MKRTRVHIDAVAIDASAAKGLDPVRLRAEIASEIRRAMSQASPARTTSRVPLVRVDASANAGNTGIARAVASAISRSAPARGRTR